MHEGAADLTGFPVLRIDQLNIISTERLAASLQELELILENGESDGLRKYMSRQVDEMKVILLQRAASARIERLLSGVVEEAEYENKADTNAAKPRLIEPILNTSGHSLMGRAKSRPPLQPRPLKEDSVDVQRSASLNGEETWTLRASLAAHQSFGMVYTVAGVEKKKRFYPKKVCPELKEEVVERDRLTRYFILIRCNSFHQIYTALFTRIMLTSTSGENKPCNDCWIERRGGMQPPRFVIYT